MSLQCVTGDATRPIGGGEQLIVHICNDVGGWGMGFVLALSRWWKAPEWAYRQWFKEQRGESDEMIHFEPLNLTDDDATTFKLGNAQFVKVEDHLHVVNMIGQRDLRRGKNGEPPIRYDAVRQALKRVAQFAIKQNASIHMPRIGCGLAGGEWSKIEAIIKDELLRHNLDVVVYDLP